MRKSNTVAKKATAAKPMAMTKTKRKLLLLSKKEGKDFDAYEKLVKAVNAKRRKEGREEIGNESNKNRSESQPVTSEGENENAANMQMVEDDNIMDITVLAEQETEEFPTPSEEELDSESDDEDQTAISLNDKGNANIQNRSRPLSSVRSTGKLPETIKAGPSQIQTKQSAKFTIPKKTKDSGLEQTFSLIQSFMLKKGLIKEPHNDEEMNNLIQQQEGENWDNCRPVTLMERIEKMNASNSDLNNNLRSKGTNKVTSKRPNLNCNGSLSKLTIYKSAVEQENAIQATKTGKHQKENSNVNRQIMQFIEQARKQTELAKPAGGDIRKY